MEAVVNPIQALTFSNAAAASRPHRWRCTTSVSPRDSATPNSTRPAARPHTPRADNGGHSVNRNFVAGQLSPHPNAVDPTQANPTRRDLDSTANKGSAPDRQFRVANDIRTVVMALSAANKPVMPKLLCYVNNNIECLVYTSLGVDRGSGRTSADRSPFSGRVRRRLHLGRGPRDGPRNSIVSETEFRCQRTTQQDAHASKVAASFGICKANVSL